MIAPLPGMRLTLKGQRENVQNQKNKAAMCMKTQGRSKKSKESLCLDTSIHKQQASRQRTDFMTRSA